MCRALICRVRFFYVSCLVQSAIQKIFDLKVHNDRKILSGGFGLHLTTHERRKTMNKKLLAILCCLLSILCIFCGCTQENPQNKNMTDTVSDGNVVSDGDTAAVFADGDILGEGAIALTIKVVDADATESTFTVKTDADNLADALLDAKLVEGDDGDYGLYIKLVNGIRADYDLDKAYWSLQQNGELLMTGANDTPIADGEHYELVYTAD